MGCLFFHLQKLPIVELKSKVWQKHTLEILQIIILRIEQGKQ